MLRRDFLKGVTGAFLVPVIATPILLKTSIPSRAPITLDSYWVGYQPAIRVSGGDWELGDLIQLKDTYYTVIEKNKVGLILDRPLEQNYPRGTPVVYGGRWTITRDGPQLVS